MWILLCVALFTGTIAGIGVRQYRDTKYAIWVYENGRHVQAVVEGGEYDDGYYYMRYVYIDENYKYKGTEGKYAKREEAEARIGVKVEIVIDGKGVSVLASERPQMTGLGMLKVCGGICGAALLGIVILGIAALYRRLQTKDRAPLNIKKGLLGIGFIACLLTLFGGMVLGKAVMIFVGFGVMSGGALLVSAVILIRIFVRAGNKPRAERSATTDDPFASDGEIPSAADGKEEEAEQIDRINSTYGYDNKIAMAEHQFAHIKTAFRASDRKEKVFGCIFLIVLLSLLAGFPIAMVFGQNIVGFCCLGAFAFIIILSMVIVTVRQKISRSERGYDMSDPHRGKVLSCSMSSESSTGSDHRTRIMSTVYKVKIAADGEERTAYTREFFHEGEEVTVYFHCKYKGLAKVAENSCETLVKETEELLKEAETLLREDDDVMGETHEAEEETAPVAKEDCDAENAETDAFANTQSHEGDDLAPKPARKPRKIK